MLEHKLQVKYKGQYDALVLGRNEGRVTIRYTDEQGEERTISVEEKSSMLGISDIEF